MCLVDINMYIKYLKEDLPTCLCGECALYRNGLSYQHSAAVQVFTRNPDIHGCSSGMIYYYYSGHMDLDYECSPLKDYPNIYLPTRERTLVQMIKYKNYFNEGSLIEGLINYLEEPDMDHLYSVAGHFKVKRETIDYWVNEAKEDDYTLG